MTKILSIIIPSYNMEAYLPKSIGSLIVNNKALLEQLDIIVVNDGSNDSTSEIAHNFESRYPGVIRVIDKPNGHYGSCINVALPVVAGTYVKVLDADDYVETEAFSRFCELVENEVKKGDLGADLLVSAYKQVTPGGDVIEVFNDKMFGLDENNGYYTLNEYPKTSWRFPIHSIVYRTSILRNMEYRQTEGMCYTDTEWIIEPMTGVRRFLYFNDVITNYLVGREGQSMDLAVFARDLYRVANIANGLVERYPKLFKQCEASSKSYYRTQIVNVLAMIYYGWYFGWYGHKCNVDIADFDKKISRVHELYELVGQRTFDVPHYRFFFIRSWRRWHCRCNPEWVLFQLVLIALRIYGIGLKMLKGAKFKK